MQKLEVKYKTLKLVNVLCLHIDINNTDLDIDMQVEKMQSYIKTKGTKQLGPLIQYTDTYVNDNSEVDINMSFMLQCSNLITKVEKPYTMEPMIRVTDCMYVHYEGPQDKLKFAYDKVNLEAFESDIKLAAKSYTIFITNNEEEETIVADVFVPMMK